MRRLRLLHRPAATVAAGLLSLLACVNGPAAAATSTVPTPLGLHVSQNQLLNSADQPLRLLGVNRSGTEYACAQGWGVFDGPSSAASIAAIASWDTNAVRVPLNEDCWLGINSSPSVYSGAVYRSAIQSYVAALHAAGLYAVLDLHWSAPGKTLAKGQQVMADADHSPAFWSSVATTFKADPAVAFDLYNEPHDISWTCWRNGCKTPAGWRAAGMQSLVDAVRSTGATQPLLVAGLGWAGDLSGWLANRPADPAGQMAASVHLYDFSVCATTECWDRTIAPVSVSFPVVTGEVGDSDCAHGFTDSYTAWADAHGISYLGWSWNTSDCAGGPSLITSYDGSPTAFGIGLRDHLRSLAAGAAPSASAAPTASPTPSPTASLATATPGGFDFEDGTSQGWSVTWGTASSFNVAGAGVGGSRALAVSTSGGYPAVGVLTGSGTPGVQQGTNLVAHVYVPATAPALTIEPWTQDATWKVAKAPSVTAAAGVWTTVSWTVPSSTVVDFGLQIDAGAWSGTVYVDNITW